MNSKARYFFVLILLVGLTGASCPHRMRTPGEISPVAFLQPPSLQEIVTTINANTARVQQLQATSATLHIAGVPSLRTSLALDRPLRFRMQAGTGLTGTELDLGSNEDTFWLWAKRNDPPATYYGRHREYNQSAARSILPVPPNWLIEALGLVMIDIDGSWEGPFLRDAGRLEIRGRVPTASGVLTKVIVLDDRRGVILEQHVYDEGGQLLATALATQHTFDVEHQVTLPRQIDIQLPPAQLAFSLEIDGFHINQIRADPSSLWAMPQIRGSQLVPLTAAPHGAMP